MPQPAGTGFGERRLPVTSAASVYQLHPGGWLRRVDAAEAPPSPDALDAALADKLVPYARQLGFTQIELLSNPVTAAEPPVAAPLLPRLTERCRSAGLDLLPPGSSALLVAASEDGMGFDDPWRTDLAAELRRHLPPKGAAADPRAALPADRLQRFAALRARLALMWAQPGTKRVAMGSEFAQQRPWALDGGLDWHLLADPLHEGVQRLVHDLNHLRLENVALREPVDAAADGDAGGRRAPHAGFFWVERDNVDGGVLAFVRVAVEPPHTGAVPAASADRLTAGQADAAPPGATDVTANGTHPLIAAPGWLITANLSPVAQPSYRLGVPRAGRWVERLFSGSTHYGGDAAGWPNGGAAVTEAVAWSGHAQSLVLALPARSTLLLEHRP